MQKFRFLLFLLPVLLLAGCGKTARAPIRYSESQVDSFLTAAGQSGLLDELNVQSSEARVRREIWDKLPASAQESSARLLAEASARLGRREAVPQTITIVDVETGNPLARYDEALGFKKE